MLAYLNAGTQKGSKIGLMPVETIGSSNLSIQQAEELSNLVRGNHILRNSYFLLIPGFSNGVYICFIVIPVLNLRMISC